MKRKRVEKNDSLKIVDNCKSTSDSLSTTSCTDNMAPALLSVKGKSEKKISSGKLSKQNMKKMDPEDIDKNQQPAVNFKELETKIDLEDQFICNLLAHIPAHGTAVQDEEEESVVTKGTEGEEKPSKPTMTRVSNPDELKERLAAKLSQFQGKKLDFSGKKMKMKLKKKLDKLEKKKLKRKNSKMKSKIAKLAQETKAATAAVKTEAPEPVLQSRPPKPIFNSEGRMVFSKFDFGELTAPTPVLKKTSTKDPKTALQKIKKVKEKLDILESKGETEKVQSIQEQRAWDGALQRAEGLKVKDNEEMLVKSLKRKELKKRQSKKKWEERIQAQEKRQEDAQKKRKTNIKARKEKIKEKKFNKLAKKGKIILK